jgi:hypothetical protein
MDVAHQFFTQNRRQAKPEPAKNAGLKCRVFMKNGRWLVPPQERPILREPPVSEPPPLWYRPRFFCFTNFWKRKGKC